MKRLLLFTFLMIFSFFAEAQVVIKKTLHQYGDIFAYSNRVVDFHIENRGKKPIEVSNIQGPEELSCLVSNTVIKPGETILFRVKYNPTELGLFHEKVSLSLSGYSKPVEFMVEGKSHYLPNQESLACPNFQTIEANLKIPFEMDVKVIDKSTGKPVPNAKVKLYTKGLELKTMQANTNGQLRFNTFLGYYYFIVSADGYETKKFDEYVNHHNPDVLVRMAGEKEEEEEEPLVVEKPISIDDYDPKYKPIILFNEEDTSEDVIAKSPPPAKKKEEERPIKEEVASSKETSPVLEEPPLVAVKPPKKVSKRDTLSFSFPEVYIRRDRMEDSPVTVNQVEIKIREEMYSNDEIKKPTGVPEDYKVKRSEIKRDLNEMRAEMEAEEERLRLEREKEEAQRKLEEARMKREEERKREAERLAEAELKAKEEEARRREKEERDKARVREEIEVIDLVPALEQVMDEELELPTKDYRANNVVFLVDISGSMANDGKMELLKSSIIELLAALRPIDQMALVSYSSDAKVLLPTTSAMNQDTIIKILMNLEAGGSSSGKKGLRVAYRQAKDGLIKDGNNMVIIATDGAFDDVDGMKFQIQKGKIKGIKLSVIGLRNRDKTVESMKNLAEFGRGNYIHIDSFKDAQSYLLEEIKFQSKIQQPASDKKNEK